MSGNHCACTGEAVCVSIVCSLRVARELYSCERVASESVAICAAARLGRGHLACKSMVLQRRAGYGRRATRRGSLQRTTPARHEYGKLGNNERTKALVAKRRRVCYSDVTPDNPYLL